MKTKKFLPNINNIDLCGRIYTTPLISKSGNVMNFDLIRNFGGDKQPIINSFVMFKPKDGFPEFLKKGAAIIAHAYQAPNNWTDKDGNIHEEIRNVIKRVEVAELVEREVRDDEPDGEAEAPAEEGEHVDIQAE